MRLPKFISRSSLCTLQKPQCDFNVQSALSATMESRFIVMLTFPASGWSAWGGNPDYYL